mmetsp:Transcript_60346/g.152809  ORF Transcript_60346/g.152809 Transcript_60346/m.152809 type:complete len:101 (-) Transcript_60346:82-384(-)
MRLGRPAPCTLAALVALIALDAVALCAAWYAAVLAGFALAFRSRETAPQDGGSSKLAAEDYTGRPNKAAVLARRVAHDAAIGAAVLSALAVYFDLDLGAL